MLEPQDVPLDDDELMRLDELLAVSESDESMDLEALDGFLVAAAICPDPLSEDERLAEVIGGDPNEVYTDAAEELSELRALLARHAHVIALSLAEEDAYAPLILDADVEDDAPDEEMPAEGHNWSAGFAHAMSLRQGQWQAAFDSEEALAMMMPVLTLLAEQDVEGAAEWTEELPEPLDAEQREALFEDMSGNLPALYRWFRD